MLLTDLGVLVDNYLRFTKHYRSIFNRANHRSSLILKSFQSRNPQLLLGAFTVYVRPLLDYCSPVWAPVYKTVRPINLSERVQRRFTKRLLGLKDISYHDRLVILDTADTLEIRRLKMDLMATISNLLNLYVITMPASFHLLVDELTHGTIYPLTL